MIDRLVAQKRRPGPPPTGKGIQVQVRLQPEDLAALDAFAVAVEEHGTDTSRPEAIRAILREWLSTHGFLKRHADPAPTGPATEAVRDMDRAIEEHRRQAKAKRPKR